MANIHVRDIDDHALDVLRHQAEACGRSLNAELKRVIEQAARAADADAAGSCPRDQRPPPSPAP